jgi:hypothetical protein
VLTLRNVIALIALLQAIPASAATVAYWRFDDPVAANGQPVPAPGPGGGNAGQPYSPYIVDSSGNGNDLRTYSPDSPDSRPRWSTDVPFGTVPQTGAGNGYSLQFTPNQDLYSAGPGTGIDLTSHVFSTGFTIEASFKALDYNRYHGIVGKDGSPLSGSGEPLAAIQMKMRGDTNRLQIELLDSAGNYHSIQSNFVPDLNTWYNIAAVSDGAILSLYVKGPGDTGYVLQGFEGTTGGFYNGGSSAWTVGRGYYNSNIADWTNGFIDEVRISDTALLPSQFLAVAPVPEPSSVAAAMGLALAAGLAFRRRMAAR